MSGDGKRGDGHRPPATAPIFDSTYDEKRVGSFEDSPIIRAYIEFDRHGMAIIEINILTTNLYLSEPYENYK
jgi:hypothetical protein